MLVMILSYPISGSADSPSVGKGAAQVKLLKQAPQKEQGKLPLDELRIFTEVMQRIKSAYVEEVDDKTLLDSAIKGMLSELDPHSAYLKPKEYKELEINTSGEFSGLGMEVTMQDGYVKVVTPIDDTPAYKAGVKAGDLIIKLDNSPVKGMTLMQAVEKMRGKLGEPIKLTITRYNKARPINLIIKRDIIKVQSVKRKTLEEGYGYIRLSQFQSNTDKELIKNLKQLKEDQKDHNLKGLVLDLRNNPGGVLQSAVRVADAFLKKGLIVYTQGRISDAEFRFNATPSNPAGNVPLVVLINGGSASASEIVAGALQDHHRAIIIGSTSFGKGSVQSVLPLSVDKERGLKLTTALYYTPNGRSIQAEGIKPDIVLSPVKITPLENEDTHYKEADLKGHLSNNPRVFNRTKKDSKGKIERDRKENQTRILEEDYPLTQALNVVKGMYLATLSTPPHPSAVTASNANKK